MGINSTSDWERKWKLMIDRDNNKKLQNEILNEKLKEKNELEESIECTFHPKILKHYGGGYMMKRSREELLELLLPIISEEESILMELREIESEENRNIEELKDVIRSTMYKFPSETTNYFLNFYRDERLKDISNIKNLKLEIVGKLQELERQFNILCSNESIDSSDLKRVGFDIDNCKNIKREILKSIDSYHTLKNRYKISREFEEIIKELDMERDHNSSDQHYDYNNNNNHNINHPNNRNRDINGNQMHINIPNSNQLLPRPLAHNPMVNNRETNTHQLNNYQANHQHLNNSGINNNNQYSHHQQPLHNPYLTSKAANYTFQPSYTPNRYNTPSNSILYPPNNIYTNPFNHNNDNFNNYRQFTKLHSTHPFINH